MTNPDYTALVLVVDRSGSVSGIRKDLEGGVNSLIEEQTTLPGKCTVDVVLFDDRYEEVVTFGDPAVTNVSIVPRGTTALHDAVGKKIVSFGEELAKLPEDERPGKVLFVIATDGQENASREFTHASVAALIKTQREEFNWDFVFLGANQDAVLTAKNLNIDGASAITFKANAAGVDGSAEALRTYASTYRSGGKAAFSDEDRLRAVGSSN